MTETAEIPSDAGFASLADASTDDDLPLTVRGVAIAEDAITFGGSKERRYWPREALAESADGLAGRKLVDDSAHDLPDDYAIEDIPKQPPIESVIGEVTDSRYEDGVGVVYEAEVDDEDVAALVQNSRVSTSPFLFPKLGEMDEERDARRVEGVAHWRDLAVVSEGNSGASIEPAAMASERLTAEALAAVFSTDGEGGDGPHDDPKGASTGPDGDADGEGGTPSQEAPMELSDTEKEIISRSRAMDSPTVVEESLAETAQTAEQFDEPKLVETDDYEALSAEVESVKGVLAEALADRTGMKAETAEALSLKAIVAEFEDEEGEFSVDALTQEPEAGGDGEEEEEESGPDVDSLSNEEREEIDSLASRAETFDSIDAEHADALRQEAADIAGADDFSAVEEVL